MAMNMDQKSAFNSEINVTPMIDVLLVLLIIFMVIVPAVPKGESARLPHPAKHASDHGDAVVLEVSKAGSGGSVFRINQKEVARQDLPARLAEIYSNRAERTLFVRGDDNLSFTQVAEAIDIGHAAGIDRVGLLTPGLQAGN